MIEWRPIESAPPDRRVLLYENHDEVGIVYSGKFDQRSNKWEPDYFPWMGCLCCSDDSKPSHWQDLPEEPEALKHPLKD